MSNYKVGYFVDRLPGRADINCDDDPIQNTRRCLMGYRCSVLSTLTTLLK